MKSTNTFQTLRDLPNYPAIVARIVGVLHLFMGLAQLLLGLFLLTQNETILSLWALLNFFNPNARTEAILTAISAGVYLNGGILVFFGLASLWVAFGNFTVRPSIWVTTIWVTGLLVLGWVTGLGHVTSVVQYVLIVIAAAAVVLYLFDNRIKAYFAHGPLATQYAEWRSESYLGRTKVASPWEYELKPPPAPIKPL